MPLLLVLTTLPDQQTARQLARQLVEAGLAACVNVMPPCQSVYRWQDGLQEDAEIPLFIKTTAQCYPALETYLRQHHPYQLPEIIALPIDRGLPDYLSWAAAATHT